jgi:hypothetical protein
MCAKRVTIGLKPVDTGLDPAIPVDPPGAAFDVDRAVSALEFLSAKATGAKPMNSSAEAWIRRGGGEPVLSLTAMPGTFGPADKPAPTNGVLGLEPSPPALAKAEEPEPTRATPAAGLADAASGEALEPASPVPSAFVAAPAPEAVPGYADPVPRVDTPDRIPAILRQEGPQPAGTPPLVGEWEGATVPSDDSRVPGDVALLVEAPAPEPASPESSALVKSLSVADTGRPPEPAVPIASLELAEGAPWAEPVGLAPPETSATAAEAISAAPASSPAVAPAPVETHAPAAVAAVGPRMSTLSTVLVAAGVGAAVAALVITVLVPRFLPSIDLRLAPVADRVAKVEARVEQVGGDIGRLNNEVASAIDSDGSVATRVAAQTAQLAEIERRLAEKPDPAAARADPAVFAVSVAQLRAAFYGGRPFESELVNVYAMARGDERFTGLLNELSGPARTGLPNAAVMRQQFWAFANAAGLTIGAPQSYYGYGMSIISQYVGFSTQPYSMEMGNAIVTVADHKLANADVAGAVEALGGIDPTLITQFQPWLATANVYIRAESAIAQMTAVVIETLRQRMGNADAG